jgi:anthranilate phosphoribosyltransferase
VADIEDETGRASNGLDAYGGWPGILGTVSSGADLSSAEAHAAMGEILDGAATSAQIAGLIVALRLKGESVVEMTGLADAMLEAAEPLTVPADAIDIVGTGGSAHRRRHALNVSTMASFVAAGAGAVVCKHGNFRASSTSGSFDFLTTLGVNVGLDAAQLESCLAQTGLGFALARTFHPAMRHAGPVRAELGIPTVFNVLGPIAHPGRVKRQLIGTADEKTASLMAEVVAAMGSIRVWVVTGAGGLDEISTTGPSVIFDVSPSGIERLEIDLLLLGITPPRSTDDLAGGDAADNVAIFNSLLDGSETSARRDIVVLNAGAGLVVAGIAQDLATGIRLASDAIDDGRVRAKVDQLVEVSNSFS